MRKLNSVLILLFVSMFYFGFAKETNKDELFAKLQKEFKNLESVHILFSMSEGSNLMGELHAKKGGKMRLSLKDNIIISDGKSIWNVNPGSSVSISDYEASSDFSLENIFFDLVEELEPISYSSLSKTNSSEKNSLKLAPKKNSKYKDRIKYMNVYLNSSSDFTRIQIISNDSSSMTYVIKSLEINPKIGNDKFTFKPSPDLEVIDFR